MKLNKFWKAIPQVQRLFAALDNNARFVGGCVRNSLIHRDITDIDIATPLAPEKVIELLEQSEIKVIPTGLKHGTVTAILDGLPFEITTLRKDVSCDGRHADVEFTDSWEEDAARRDFTFNAMSCTLEGELFDYFGGKEDLSKGRVKFVGDAYSRCQEDYLRILRFFRFFAYYGTLPVDPDSVKACSELAENIQQLSGERIQNEVFKILQVDNPVDVLRLMDDHGVLKHLLPGDINFEVINNYIHYEKEFKLSKDPICRLAKLLRSDRPEIYSSDLANRWRLSNQDTRQLLFLSDKNCFISANISVADQKKYIRQWGKDNFRRLIIFSWAETVVENNENDLRAQYVSMLELVDCWNVPEFPVTGKDIMKLGIEEGKEIGVLLAEAEDYWENYGYQPSKKELLKRIKDNITV